MATATQGDVIALTQRVDAAITDIQSRDAQLRDTISQNVGELRAALGNLDSRTGSNESSISQVAQRIVGLEQGDVAAVKRFVEWMSAHSQQDLGQMFQQIMGIAGNVQALSLIHI